MTFDGAAYYGLPTASQASSSTSLPFPGNQAYAYSQNQSQYMAAYGGNGNSNGMGRSIIQRPYSYPHQQGSMMSQALPGMYTAHGAPAQVYYSQNPQMWQQPHYQQNAQWQLPNPTQYSQPTASRSLPMPPLPSGPPPPAPPPLRHALPPKPQSAAAVQTLPSSRPYEPVVRLSARPPAPSRTVHKPPEAPLAAPPPQLLSQTEYATRPGTNNQRHFCDLCKVPFTSSIYLIAHQRNEHVRCCKQSEGCTFEGLPHVVELHEQDRHLIFKPGARREKTKPDGPAGAKIQGTNLSLETEEDIAKWIEERKKKWPGSKNQQLRVQRDLKRKAYDAASPAMSGRQDVRGGKRGREAKTHILQHTQGVQRAPRIWGQPAEVVAEAAVATNGNTAVSAQSQNEKDATALAAAQLNKTDEVQAGVGEGKVDSAGLREEVLSMSAAAPVPEATIFPSIDDNQMASDTESAPEETRIIRANEDDHAAEESQAQEQNAPGTWSRDRGTEDISQNGHGTEDQLRDCRAWSTTVQCKFGSRCHFKHDPVKRYKRSQDSPKQPKNPFERGDLIGKLVRNEIRREVSDLTQVIDFLARNDWLVNVELYPGHGKELKNRIREVADEDSSMQAEEQIVAEADV